MNLAKKLWAVTVGILVVAHSSGYVGDVFSTYVYKGVTS